jgi:hypothetical protein
MTAKTLAAALAATLLVTACAHPTVWDGPPGTDQAQFHRDNLECAMQAKALNGDGIAFGPPLFVAVAIAAHQQAAQQAHDECMLGKSYTVHASK